MAARTWSAIWLVLWFGACTDAPPPGSSNEDDAGVADVETVVPDVGPDDTGEVPDIDDDAAEPGCTSDEDCTTDDPCQAGLCNIDGSCRFVLQPGPCDDGDPCTISDQCGVDGCAGELRSCDDGNDCTLDACNPVDGACVSSPAQGPCDDGNACTQGDRCTETGCEPQGPVICNDGNPCTADECDAAAGGCVAKPLEDAPCDDGNLCTVGDKCSTGFCLPGTTIQCNDDNPCTDDVCNGANGFCEGLPNTGPCSDGNFCTLDDACEDGGCKPGTEKDCSDGNVCTADTCVPGNAACLHQNKPGECNDGDLCTVGDTCFGGNCQSGPPKACIDGNPCTEDLCDAQTGQCAPIPVGGACNDGDDCTVNDFCAGGSCQPGMPKICDDDNACTADSCGTDGDCDYQPLADVTCDDLNDCTESDVCVMGACAGTPLDCDDDDPCTVGDGCVFGECVQGQPVDCDDENPCTLDECVSAAGGCVSTNADETPCVPSGNPCFDGVCTAGACVLDEPKDCSDDDLCTIDSCDPASGCEHEPEDCDGIACLSGTCEPQTGCQYETSEVICDDGIACSLDSCVPAVGCQTEYPAGCCEARPFSEDFSLGLTGWTVFATDDIVRWQAVDGLRSVSGTASLYYGSVASLNYDTPGFANSGKAVSPTFTVPTATDVWLRFYVWVEVEMEPEFDNVGLRVLPSGTEVWNKGDVTETASWQYVLVDLKPYAGQTIQLQFEMNTLDPDLNTLDGVYVDEIQVLGCQ